MKLKMVLAWVFFFVALLFLSLGVFGLFRFGYLDFIFIPKEEFSVKKENLVLRNVDPLNSSLSYQFVGVVSAVDLRGGMNGLDCKLNFVDVSWKSKIYTFQVFIDRSINSDNRITFWKNGKKGVFEVNQCTDLLGKKLILFNLKKMGFLGLELHADRWLILDNFE